MATKQTYVVTLVLIKEITERYEVEATSVSRARDLVGNAENGLESYENDSNILAEYIVDVRELDIQVPNEVLLAEGTDDDLPY